MAPVHTDAEIEQLKSLSVGKWPRFISPHYANFSVFGICFPNSFSAEPFWHLSPTERWVLPTFVPKNVNSHGSSLISWLRHIAPCSFIFGFAAQTHTLKIRIGFCQEKCLLKSWAQLCGAKSKNVLNTEIELKIYDNEYWSGWQQIANINKHVWSFSGKWNRDEQTTTNKQATWNKIWLKYWNEGQVNIN